MWAVFRHAILRERGQILGWGIGLGLLAAMIILPYDSLMRQREQLQALVKALPPEMMAFFGGMTDLLSPAGYLNMQFYSYMPIVVGIYAVLAGSGLVASDEENGTLDLVLAHPISRTALFLGRVWALAAAMLGILAITWLGFIAALPFTAMPVSPLALIWPILSLFAVIAFFAALALLLSMVLPSRRLAASVAGLLLVASYTITSLATLIEGLATVARFSPLNYYQGGRAVDGLNWGWLAWLLGAAVLCSLLAWLLFEGRDIRVGGEGGWRIPTLRRGAVYRQHPPTF